MGGFFAQTAGRQPCCAQSGRAVIQAGEAVPSSVSFTAAWEGKGALRGLPMAFGYFSLEGTCITSAPKSLARLTPMDLPTEEN